MSKWLAAIVLATAAWFMARTAVAAPPLQCPSTVTGTIVSPGDAKQNGRLNRGVPVSTCAAPTPVPQVVNPGSKFTYDAYTFKNRSATASCVSVTLTSADDLSAAAYAGAFDPDDIQKDYIANSGNRASVGNPATFSFQVGSLQDFVVVVTEGVDGAGGNYVLAVSGCGDVVVTSVTPSFGPTAGGTNVVIKGAGFLAPPTPVVTFGGVPATNVVVVDEFTITATSPPHAAGAVDVTVLNGNGTTGTLPNGFTYYAPIASTVTLTSTPNPSVFGQNVTFTATVTPTTPTYATGTVTFRNNGVAIGTAPLDANGVATLSTAALAIGTHPITADYGGDALFLAATSNTVNQVVDKANTSTTLISSSNPSLVGQAVTFTATVAAVAPGSGTPTGDVTFSDEGTALATVPLDANGQATFTTSTLTVGTHSITASYAGETRFNPSQSATLAQVVNLAGTTLVLVSSKNPSTFDESVTFTATVSANVGGAPTGAVTFMEGSAVLSGPTLIDANGEATFATTTLTPGTHAITATYSGDASHSAATGAVSQVVQRAPTTTTLVSSLNPSAPGQSVTFTATVASTVTGVPTGTVTFKSGTTTLAEVPLGAGTATFTTSALTPGTHPITAAYAGDTTFAASTSPVVNQVVQQPVADAGPDAAPPADAAPRADASPPPVDAGTTPPRADRIEGGGCDCRSANGVGSGSVVTWLAVVAFLARRRKRARSKARDD